ncbi:hypothetical protein RIF29_33581 [Crotalaria pallida]|uniref:Uncharacterized protein n=1 Tax=Crotalaria pallida TaxID=3830 RepID=A0AAN9HU49_CROPI
MEVIQDSPKCSVWDRKLNEHLAKQVLMPEDDKRFCRQFVNVIRGIALVMEEKLLWSASLALFVAKIFEEFFSTISAEHKEARKSGSVHEEVLRNQLLETTQELEKQTKLVVELRQRKATVEKAKDEAKKTVTTVDEEKKEVEDDLANARRESSALTKEKNRLQMDLDEARAEVEQMKLRAEKMKKKDLKNKKDALKNLHIWDKATTESFVNVVKQLQLLNSGSIRVEGADPYFEVVDGRLVD